MVTLNTLLLVGMIIAVVASVSTIALSLLLGTYMSVKEVKTARAEAKEDDDSGVFTIPMGALGVPRGITQADINEARAKMVAHQEAAQGGVGGEEKKPEYVPGKGAYL